MGKTKQKSVDISRATTPRANHETGSQQAAAEGGDTKHKLGTVRNNPMHLFQQELSTGQRVAGSGSSLSEADGDGEENEDGLELVEMGIDSELGRKTDYCEVDAKGNPIKLANNSSMLSIFLLVNTMIGSGILNQPFVFKDAGIVGALLGFVVATWSTWMSLLLLTDVGIAVQLLEYSGLAEKAFKKLGLQITDFGIAIGSFGALLGYILVIGEMMSGLLKAWGCTAQVCSLNGITTLFVCVFVLPLCLMRHFGHLAYVAVFSIITICCVLVLVTIGGPIRTRNDTFSEPINGFNLSGTLRSVGSIIFALGCTPACLQTYVAAEKSARNMKTWTHVTMYATMIGAAMCAIMGLAGYMSFQGKVQGNILTNFTTHAFDFFKMMVVIHLVCYIPVDFIIMRYSIVKLALNKKSETLPTWQHVTITVCLLGFTTVFILIMLGAGLSAGGAFTLTLDITGGVGGSITGFIMPSAIYLKLMPESSTYYSRAKLLFCLGWVFMVLVLTGIVMQLQEKKKI